MTNGGLGLILTWVEMKKTTVGNLIKGRADRKATEPKGKKKWVKTQTN